MLVRLESRFASWFVAMSALASLAWLAWGSTTSPSSRLAMLIIALLLNVVAVFALLASNRRPRIPLVVGALVMVVAVLLPPRGSRDLWAYAMQGRIVAIHHANPYVHRPAEFASDPALARVAPGWRESRSPYGPVFVGVEAVGASITRGSSLGARLYYQGLAAAAVLSVALALSRRPDGGASAVFLLLNPAIVEAVNGGHNDVLVGVGLLAAVALADRKRAAASAVVLAAVALVKVTVLVAGLALGVWLWRQAGRRLGLLFTATAGAVFTAGYGAVGGWAALDPVRSASSRGSRAAALGVPREVLVRALMGRGESEGRALAGSGHLVALLAITAAVVSLGFLVFGRRRTRSVQTVVVVPMAVLIVLSAYVLPWYVLWILPLAARRVRSMESAAAWVIGASLLLAYNEPPGVRPAINLTRDLSNWALPAGLVLIVILVVLVRLRDRKPRSTALG